MRRRRAAGLLVVIAGFAAVFGHQLPASSSPTAASSEAAGAVPDGTTVFDEEIPGVAKLDADLLGALRQAATDAADDGVEAGTGGCPPLYADPTHDPRMQQ